MAVEQHSQTIFDMIYFHCYCSDFRFVCCCCCDWLEPFVTWSVGSRDVVGKSAGSPISVSEGWNATDWSFKPDPDWKWCNCCGSPPTAPTCGESGDTWLPTRPLLPTPVPFTPPTPLVPGCWELLLPWIEFWSRLSRSYEDYWISIRLLHS